MKYCTNCGKKITGNKYCTSCGSKIKKSANKEKEYGDGGNEKAFKFLKRILFFSLAILFIFFLSNMGYMPVWFWELYPIILVVFGTLIVVDLFT